MTVIKTMKQLTSHYVSVTLLSTVIIFVLLFYSGISRADTGQGIRFEPNSFFGGDSLVELYWFLSPASTESAPTGMSWYENSLWVSGSNNYAIFQLDTLGNVIASYDLRPIFLGISDRPQPLGIEWKENELWIALKDHPKKLYNIDLITNQIISFIHVVSMNLNDITALTWDGHYFWASSYGNSIECFDEYGSIIDSLSFSEHTKGLTWVDGCFWLLGLDSMRIYKTDISGAVVSQYSVVGESMLSMTYGQETFWISIWREIPGGNNWIIGRFGVYCHYSGDVNTDCVINVLDVLMVANIILDNVTPTPEQSEAGDCNGPPGNCDGDGQINVLDAIKIVNLILGSDTCP